MRVIAGTARGRKLATPKGLGTRPTPDRVREALFSILAPRLDDALVLDLFAGTGALGIEALSRGVRKAFFVEQSRQAVELLRRNLEVLEQASAEVLSMPTTRALGLLAMDGHRFDIVLLDPPYDADLLEPTLCELFERELVATTGVVVCEHHTRSSPPTPPGGWECQRTRRFGDVALSFFSEKGQST